MFCLTLLLSKYLQTKEIDLGQAILFANDVVSTLKGLRENADDVKTGFGKVFNDDKSICDGFGIVVSIPRITGKQMHRCNVDVNTPETYYKIKICIPFLDPYIMQIYERLTKHK